MFKAFIHCIKRHQKLTIFDHQFDLQNETKLSEPMIMLPLTWIYGSSGPALSVLLVYKKLEWLMYLGFIQDLRWMMYLGLTQNPVRFPHFFFFYR